jgi:hypothetical protein
MFISAATFIWSVYRVVQLSDAIMNAEHKIVDLIAQRDEDLLAVKAVWKASDNMIEESLQRMERVYVPSPRKT